MNADPLWTTSGSWTMGRDPLGLQATSIGLYQRLVPGITNITNRLRYYSYFPWIIGLYERLHHSDSAAKWTAFIRRADALYALSSMVADAAGADGLGGWDWANKHRVAAAEGGIDLKRYADDPDSSDRYLQAPRGTFGNAYAPTFVELELIGIPKDSPVPRILQRGQALAIAFAQSIGPVGEVVERILLSGTASADELMLVGGAIHPARIPEGSDELALLRDFMLGGWGGKHAAERCSTAWLLLDAYRRGVVAGNTDQLRRLWYERQLPDGQAYTQSGETIDRWRAYQANEYCHIALECLLNGFVGTQLEDHPEGIEPSQLLEKVASQALLTSDGSWEGWALEVAEDAGADEASLAGSINQALQTAKRPDGGALLASLRLLARLWARWAGENGGVRKTIALIAGPNGRSLDSVCQTLDASADLSVEDAAIALMRRHILIDHQAIAGQKLADAGTYTYHFLVADGLLTDGELGEYTYTNPRLGNFTRLLRDARLIGDNGISADGEAFLANHQPL